MDIYHGAKPFLATMCYEGHKCPIYWEWDVDPYTREPHIPKGDAEDIEQRLMELDEVWLQNPKYDVGIWRAVRPKFKWPWSKTKDTLLAAHLLNSKLPQKDLTTLTLVYLHYDVEPYELAIKAATEKARSIVKRDYPKWRFARRNLSDMPSAKEKVWKFDMWIVRELAKAEQLREDHEWWNCCAEYANSDTAATAHLYPVMRKLIEERGLEAIYEERLRLPQVALWMEQRGITASAVRRQELQEEYAAGAAECGQVCVNIAAAQGHEIKLPKGAAGNKSVKDFVFGPLGVRHLTKPKAKTDAPSMESKGLQDYIDTEAPPNSKQKLFLERWLARSKQVTACSYMDGYERFWLPLGICNDKGEQLWYRLHPSLNSTGTDTLRWSSSNPNEQNISKKEGFNLRYIFGPAPGREWWSMDAKNIELRIPAYECKEQLLIDLFEKADEPPYYGSEHILNFSTVYPDIWEDAVKKVGLDKAGPYCKKTYASTWYQWCKNGDFAVGYGAIDRPDGTGTADRSFHRPGSHARLKARFAKKEQLNQHYIAYANEYGYVETLPDKSVDPTRGYPLVCTRNDRGRIKPTVPLNYHVQGTAMWWMCRAMVRIHELLTKKPGYYMVMQVHDELVFDFPKGAGKEPWQTNLPLIKTIKGLMEQGGTDIGIPTPVSCEYHPVSWDVGLTIKV